MALGVLNTMITHVWQYLRYWWNEVNFSSARITFDRVYQSSLIKSKNWAMTSLPHQPKLAHDLIWQWQTRNFNKGKESTKRYFGGNWTVDLMQTAKHNGTRMMAHFTKRVDVCGVSYTLLSMGSFAILVNSQGQVYKGTFMWVGMTMQ